MGAKAEVKPCAYMLSTIDSSAIEFLTNAKELKKINPSNIEVDMMRFLLSVLGQDVSEQTSWDQIVAICQGYQLNIGDNVI